ncbi:hypothetical protein ACFYNX_27345 [Streptomyces sp. NPDC007872]|uniref:hypothetical protein n=1 Tax=Streptomyces sp. NPDC007872 TaxID=3364782 RepID=UPI00367B94FA
MRYEGRWIIPGQPRGLNLADHTVSRWWQTRHTAGSSFALVHRLHPGETDLISANHYTCCNFTGEGSAQEPVTGQWLRSLAWQATHSRTISVHLELPNGIVTLHSGAGDVFFHPARTAAS